MAVKVVTKVVWVVALKLFKSLLKKKLLLIDFVVWVLKEAWLLKLISLVIRMKLLLPTIFSKDKWKISEVKVKEAKVAMEVKITMMITSSQAK